MKVFDKDIARSIRGSLGRFLAIAGIVALGTGFYAGLRMTCPDMNLCADEFYDTTHLMDIRVMSTLGLSDDDIEVLRDTEGVEAVMPAYEMDAMGTINTEQYAIRIHSLPDSARDSDTSDGLHAISDDDNYMNRLILDSGRWPEAEGECVVSADRVMNAPTQLGDVIHLTEGTLDLDDSLVTTEYTIVGYAHSPYYVCSSSMGTTTLGGGVVQQFMYVSESDFSDDLPYTEAFVTVEGARELYAADDEYTARVDEVKARIEDIKTTREQARTDELRADAQQEVDDAAAEAWSKLDDAKATLDQSAATIANSEAELASAQEQYDQGVEELAAKRAETQETIAKARADAKAQAAEGKRQCEEGLATINAQIEQYQQAVDEAQKALEALDPTDPDYPTKYQEAAIALATAQTTLEYAQDALQPQIDELNETLASIDEKLTEGLAQIDAQEAAAETQFEEAQKELDAAAEQLSDGYAQLSSGKSQYNSGLSSYYASVEEAQEKIDDAQAQVDDIEDAQWYVLDRTKNYGVESFKMDASRIDHIASVFPFIFFLVAALVALTTMTRMVEEERVIIGTYKALGYSKMRITAKYLIYAGIASIAGSIVGIAVLSQVLPFVIMKAYAIIYYVPCSSLPIDVGLTLLSAGLGVGLTLFSTWAAAVATLRERPASLMLPRAPKAGKRILLEHVKPVWSRLSFSWKVTCRNLFLYKKRLFMTIVGIAGCTALLLTGLGLRDSINDIIDLQFGNIVQYNATITVDEDMEDDDAAELQTLIDESSCMYDYTWAGCEGFLISPGDRSDLSLELIVPSDVQEMGDFIVWQNRKTGESLELTDDGIIIAEKVGTVMGVGVGDTLRIYEQDTTGTITDTFYDVRVAGVAENYVGNYIYMTSGLYEQTFGESMEMTKIFASMAEDKTQRDEFSAAAREIAGVKTVAYNDETIDAYRTMLKSVDMIVWVLVIAAAALAFIVLYNLTNINITERVREIATLKVLGFLPKEVSAYIYRETLLLSMAGAALGLVLGIFLESFVITSAEVDQVMFGRLIHAPSFAIAFVLTMLFTVVVMLAMHRKLHKVNMVESLKSIE